MPRWTRCLRLLALLNLFGLGLNTNAELAYKIETVAEGLELPWGLAFLPENRFLVTERAGTVRVVSADGTVGPELSGVPEVYFAGQGGLMDVVLDPQFLTNQRVYLSYAEGDETANATAIIQATLQDDGLHDVRRIFAVTPTKDTPMHYGARMAFLKDGALLVTTGDGFNFREQAQDPSVLLGKTVKLTPTTTGDFSVSVYTLGHRNAQGLVVDPLTGTAYLHEHGPRGGDELNRLEPGANYGWPIATHGLDYNGAYVSPFKSYNSMTDPVHVWVPSIAPSGLALYTGDVFPDWRGDFFVGALVDKEVRRLHMVDGQVEFEEPLFSELDSRIRDVRMGPEGFLYLVTDANPGKILRVVPN